MDEYNTPKWLKDGLFKDWFDPCPLSNGLVLINGLEIPWKPKTFVNPPYSDPRPWVEKAIEENKKGNTIALLVQNDSSTQWYKKLHEAGSYFFLISGRLHFNDIGPARFASVLILLYGEA